MQWTTRSRWAGGLISTIVVLAGCGGGGEDAGAATSNPSATTPSSGTTTAASNTLATCGLSNFAASALARINQYRAAGATCGAQGRFAATTPLAWHDTLAQAASGHALDMATQNYFSHTSLDGRTAAQRIEAAGYAWRSIGENISAGQGTVDAVVDGWMASDGHCANLMNPAFVHVGLACASGSSTTTYSSYWTLDLATPR